MGRGSGCGVASGAASPLFVVTKSFAFLETEFVEAMGDYDEASKGAGVSDVAFFAAKGSRGVELML